MRVIIADDEERVCRLIQHLVDWDELGMEMVGIAYNGVEVLSMIEVYKPDIIITDIRMPGINGLEMIQKAKKIDEHLEFIIISGYRHFEYAQNAIRYGVRDYLLKPINKNELYDVLKRMKQNYQRQHEQVTREEKYKVMIQNNRERLRNAFFSEWVLKHPSFDVADRLEKVNEAYCYEFTQGYFQIAIVKVDCIAFNREENLDYIQKKMIRLLEKKIENLCFEREYLLDDSKCIILMNYAREKEAGIYKAIKSLMNELLLQNDIFESLKVTVGMGSIEKNIEMLYKSMTVALWAVEQRLVLGGNRVIEGIKTHSVEFVKSRLFYDFNMNLSEALESLDDKKVSMTMELLKKGMEEKTDLTGHEILQTTKEAVNLYLLTMRKNNMEAVLSTGTFEEFSLSLDNYGTKQAVLDYAEKVIISSMKLAEKKKQEDGNRPIREAKNYIRTHYQEMLTLEIVSSVIGFNATYLSTLFKKETGKTFLEYLTQVRMDKAKELLKDSNENIAAICQRVGYSDTKHFVKRFQKYTGLKPNQYRKIYS